MYHPLKGLGTALVSPFLRSGELDEAAFARVINHCGPASQFVVVGGTTGEAATLTLAEKHRLLALAIAHPALSGKGVVLGLGGNNTAALLEEIATTNFDGVHAILSVTPYYTKPSARGLLAHYTILADACPVPVLLYNVPARTGICLGADLVAELAQHPNIIGLKEASDDLALFAEELSRTPDDFLMLSGDDMLAAAQIALGAHGLIGVLPNLMPDLFRSITDLALAGQIAKASILLSILQEINPLLYTEGNPVGVKAALSLLGICEPTVRLPLAEASIALVEKLKVESRKLTILMPAMQPVHQG